jgi:hypothetical protein
VERPSFPAFAENGETTANEVVVGTRQRAQLGCAGAGVEKKGDDRQISSRINALPRRPDEALNLVRREGLNLVMPDNGAGNGLHR